MKIAFVSIYNPSNRNARSGVPYSIYHQLKRKYEVEWIQPKGKGLTPSFLLFVNRIIEKVFRMFGMHVMQQTFLRSYVFSKSVEHQIFNKDFDALFFLDCVDYAFLNTSLPIFYRTDAITHAFIDYYAINVPWFSRKISKYIEERALSKCTILFAPSQWIIDSIKKFKVPFPLEKIILVHSGANIEPNYIKYRKHEYEVSHELNLLIVGYDIKRKGIIEAFEATKLLNEKYNIHATLTVVGGKPEQYMLESGLVRYAGNKDKNDKKQYDEFYKEFYQADIFLFPTKVECHGIVNCEAAAYGLPIVSYFTGGVPSYCVNGYNGICLPLSSKGVDFAKAIYDNIINGNMNLFSVNSRRFFLEKLNWECWGNVVFSQIEKSICKNE